MADDSELDYLKTWLLEILRTFTDTIASVVVGTKALKLTSQADAVGNTYAGYYITVLSGDNAGTDYTIVSNTLDDPTVLTVSETIPADLATDVINVFDIEKHVATFETDRNYMMIKGENKALIYPGETIWIDNHFYKKRYMIKLSCETELTHMATINEIVEGCLLYNTTRTGLTSVGVMCNIDFAYAGKCFVQTDGRWNQDLWIDVEWATS